MLQAQGKLWEMTSAWTEELERINAAMRELVCRRYRFTHHIAFFQAALLSAEPAIIDPAAKPRHLPLCCCL